MYSIEWARIFRRKSRPAKSETASSRGESPDGDGSKLKYVGGTVWALGFTSLLTDISSEMVSSVLPVYLVTFLGMSPLAFGMVDGLQQGAAALVRVFGGVFADRWRRHKEIAGLGYGLSAACRILLLLVGSSWSAITTVIALDRIGKGIRTGPRDALISQASSTAGMATAFGVHRALDAFGAMLGPVVAVAVLFLLPGAFNVLFVASFGIALIGLAVILIFVRGTHDAAVLRSGTRPSLKTAVGLLAHRRFRSQVLAGTVLGLATVSDSFLYLILQRQLDLAITAFPLLYVGTSLITALFALPCGQFADRWGRPRVLLGGYLVLAVAYCFVLAVPADGAWFLAIVPVVLLGGYYAATDGVLTAMAAAGLPADHAGSGLSLLATGVNVARLLASVAFGFAWSHFGLSSATVGFLLALLGAVAFAAALLLRDCQTAATPG